MKKAIAAIYTLILIIAWVAVGDEASVCTPVKYSQEIGSKVVCFPGDDCKMTSDIDLL